MSFTLRNTMASLWTQLHASVQQPLIEGEAEARQQHDDAEFEGWRPSVVNCPPISVSGIFAPADAEAAIDLPTTESSDSPKRRLTSRAMEFKVCNCVDVLPPSELVFPPLRCCERS